MGGQANKVAISVFLGACIMAAALYFGLTKTDDLTLLPINTKESTPNPSPATKSASNKSPTIEPSPTAASPTPEITWTKSDLITALSTKTGIPVAEVVFSTGEVVDHGDTKLIRGTVQRQGEMGGAGFFAVADTDGVKVTYTGQGIPDCAEVNPHGYPTSWADYCLDNGNTVKR